MIYPSKLQFIFRSMQRAKLGKRQILMTSGSKSPGKICHWTSLLAVKDRAVLIFQQDPFSHQVPRNNDTFLSNEFLLCNILIIKAETLNCSSFILKKKAQITSKVTNKSSLRWFIFPLRWAARVQFEKWLPQETGHNLKTNSSISIL